MFKLKLEYEPAKLFDELLLRGFIVKTPCPTTRELKRALNGVDGIIAGYTKEGKVLIVVEHFPPVKRRRTLTHVIYRFDSRNYEQPIRR